MHQIDTSPQEGVDVCPSPKDSENVMQRDVDQHIEGMSTVISDAKIEYGSRRYVRKTYNSDVIIT